MSRTVLVVDDDRQMVRTFAAVLKHRGWESLTAFGGEEAVAIAHRHHVDAVLMDVCMPGMNGVEALRAIRRDKPLTPVVLMTAYAANELLAQAERDGALSIMSKPVPLPRLLALLEEVIATDHAILIVDDDVALLESLTEVLAAAGRIVRRAGSVAEALSLLQSKTPTVVALDPSVDGGAPERAVLAIKRARPDVQMILLGGAPHALDDTLAALPAELVYASLTKPFPPGDLVGLVDTLIDR
jgi:DNA-binding NtrC family response regulator